jgi:hypothetical protein
MKTKTKKTLTVIGLVCALALSCFSFIIGNTAKAFDATAVTLQADELQSTFVLGDTFNVPQGKLSYGGKDYSADAVVYYPSGDAYLADSLTLDQTGVYSVEYRAVIDGNLVKKTKTFETLESLYTVGSARSSITYGKPVDLGVPFTTEQSPAGLCVSLANGDKFNYNGVIDLNKSKKGRDAIRFYLTPEKDKACDVFSIYITFTDIYNPNNYVIISMWSYNMKCYEDSPCRANYVTACVPSIGQQYTGHYNTYQVSGYGWVDTVYKNMRTSGFCSFMSSYGNNANGDVYWVDGKIENGFQVDWGYTGQITQGFWWDYENRQLCSNQPLAEFSELLADFDSPNYYSSLWDGFTTGECYVSMWAEDYNNSSFNFVVTEVDGVDLTSTEPETSYKDDLAPAINVNYGKYNQDNYPVGKVNCPYPVFETEGVDGYDGNTTVTARAFYGYGTENCYEVSCSDTFIPDRAGDYTIVYTTTDKALNTTTKEVVVQVEDTASELNFTANIDSAIKTAGKGEIIKVAEVTYSGGVGALTYTATATNTETGKVYDATNGTFRPMEGGTYEIVCQVKDFIGQTKLEKYEITVQDNASPLFITAPVIPEYLISGYVYYLPKAYATVEATGEEIEATIFVDDAGESEIKRGVYETDGDTRDVKIIYRAEKDGKTSQLVYELPLINVKKGTSIDLGKYFDCTNITTSANSNNVILTVDEGKNGGKATFINPVIAEGFTSTFTVEAGKGNFEELSMYLTDSVDKNQVVKFTWKNVQGTRYTYVNDKITTSSTMFDFEGQTSSNFVFSNSTCTYEDFTTSTSVVIEKTYKGEEFNGFTSGKVTVTFEIYGAYGESAINVSKINNQTIRTTRRDVIKPQFTLIGDKYSTQATVGDTLTLKNCVYADVLAPTTSVFITVLDPNGNAVTSKDGVKLEESENLLGEILFTENGKYTIIYTVTDETNVMTEEYIVNCVFANSIEITVKGKLPESVSLGTTVKLPTAEYKDLTGGTVRGYILIITPKGVIINVTANGSFTADIKGTYKVLYVGYDESGNSSMVDYSITVK